MSEIKFDRELAAKAYDLITEKYATEGGKKFIFHLISSFIVPSNYKVRQMTLDDSKNYKSNECCITKAKIAPVDVMVPQDEGIHYYGWITDGSNKIVSVEGLMALEEFIKKRLELGDDAIAKIHKYMLRHQQQQQKPKGIENGSRYQPHPDRNKGSKSSKMTHKSKAVESIPHHKRSEKNSEAPRYYPKATIGDIMPDNIKEHFEPKKVKDNEVTKTLSPKNDGQVKGSKASYKDIEALPNRTY